MKEKHSLDPSPIQQARAVLTDHDAVPATFIDDKGQRIDGWVVFIRELRIGDNRSELRGTFWYEWDPSTAIVDVISAGTIRCGARAMRVKVIGANHPLMSTERSLARIDFLDGRHLRE